MAPCLSRQDYTVGWVCAIPIELAAAQQMLDEQHEDLAQDENDNTVYSLGRIGQHNVVLACLPDGQIGTGSAAATAMQMVSTFRAIRFGLMVGIGGGVPTEKNDIRLGDIVVSRPTNNYGGVIQYDFGKSIPSGYEQTGSLNSPPQLLLSAVSKLRAKHSQSESKIPHYLLKIGRLPEFTRNHAGDDVLFEKDYPHDGGDTCESCSNAKTIKREARPDDFPRVHYGTIASGNTVIKNGMVRDGISSKFKGILCFEMEAAGLMNAFPCLIIRGVADYADSHKNKKWQAYAAGAAAAYAKDLLLVIPVTEVVESKKGAEVLSDSLERGLQQVDNTVRTTIATLNEGTSRVIRRGALDVKQGMHDVARALQQCEISQSAAASRSEHTIRASKTELSKLMRRQAKKTTTDIEFVKRESMQFGKRQAASAKKQLSLQDRARREMREQFEHLEATIIQQTTTLQDCQVLDHDIIFVGRHLNEVVMPLKLMQSDLSKVIKGTLEAESLPLSLLGTNWLHHEFEQLLRIGLDAEISRLRGCQVEDSVVTLTSHGKAQKRKESLHCIGEDVEDRNAIEVSQNLSQWTLSRSMYLRQDMDIASAYGDIHIRTGENNPFDLLNGFSTTRSMAFRILFIPKPGIPSKCLDLLLVRDCTFTNEGKVLRMARTFEQDHLDAEAIACCEKDDVERLRVLFSKKRALLWSRHGHEFDQTLPIVSFSLQSSPASDSRAVASCVNNSTVHLLPGNAKSFAKAWLIAAASGSTRVFEMMLTETNYLDVAPALDLYVSLPRGQQVQIIHNLCSGFTDVFTSIWHRTSATLHAKLLRDNGFGPFEDFFGHPYSFHEALERSSRMTAKVLEYRPNYQEHLAITFNFEMSQLLPFDFHSAFEVYGLELQAENEKLQSKLQLTSEPGISYSDAAALCQKFCELGWVCRDQHLLSQICMMFPSLVRLLADHGTRFELMDLYPPGALHWLIWALISGQDSAIVLDALKVALQQGCDPNLIGGLPFPHPPAMLARTCGDSDSVFKIWKKALNETGYAMTTVPVPAAFGIRQESSIILVVGNVDDVGILRLPVSNMTINEWQFTRLFRTFRILADLVRNHRRFTKIGGGGSDQYLREIGEENVRMELQMAQLVSEVLEFGPFAWDRIAKDLAKDVGIDKIFWPQNVTSDRCRIQMQLQFSCEKGRMKLKRRRWNVYDEKDECRDEQDVYSEETQQGAGESAASRRIRDHWTVISVCYKR
ncbi:MAG: hypothetical protein M1820_000216 [Bogoriella megaspora]|nr:MAG: hypothetical protein M1820_000216 [Bogoriella megaspora]